jgi:hypothetical protein
MGETHVARIGHEAMKLSDSKVEGKRKFDPDETLDVPNHVFQRKNEGIENISDS